MQLSSKDHWQREAENWLKWARPPGFDSYWYYRRVFFDELVPGPEGRTLEVGCGEGRVTRDLTQRGHRVIGLDVSSTLIRAAAEADSASAYLSGDACGLPFADATFDLVVAYNCLMDVDNMPAALAEASRVLRLQGRLAACIAHPMKDAGDFTTKEPACPFVISGAYLGERRGFDQTFRRENLEMRFHGWCYPLEAYTVALEDAGFAIERLREPSASDDFLARFGETALRWRRLPMFLMFRAVKLRDLAGKEAQSARHP